MQTFMTPALEIILHRRSVRAYLPNPVEPEKLELLLKAAMHAPSACNCQPWHFIVVDDRAVLDEIMRAHPRSQMLADAPVCVMICGDLSLETPGYHIEDCAAATENLLLAADSLGLGTCWMGVEPVAERMAAIKKLFALPENIVPFCLIAVGYPKREAPQPSDRFKTERIHRNKW